MTETVSLHPSSLLSLLLNSVNERDHSTRSLALQQLSLVEKREGFCSGLLQIILEPSIDEYPRYLALVYLKLCIDRYWISRRDTKQEHGPSESERDLIRANIYPLIKQQSNQLSLQSTIALSKIARFDFPKHK